MAATKDNYDVLVGKLREISILEGLSGLLGWDEMVMLPEGSSDCRGAQKEVLAGVIYDKKTSPELGDLVKSFHTDSSALSPVGIANVRLAHKNFIRETSLPKTLVQHMASLETSGYNAWLTARKSSNYSQFQPVLQQWVDANIAKAKHIDPSAVSPYDVLLDEYERGMTSARIDEIFTEVRDGLVPLIAELQSKGTPPDATWLKNTYDVTKQASLCREIALDIGFDINKGRLDVSVHPFTGGSHPTDVRMTTRFKENDITEGLTGAIHETGHSLYEQSRNLDDEWRDLPVNAAMSMGVHESQSLLWERMVALSRPFQSYLLPKLQATFPDIPSLHTQKEQGDRITAEHLYKAINKIRQPSIIRVEADEVTYTMHIILRYEIEKGLINGEITTDEVPLLWNSKMQSYLNVTPENDSQGCLQDVHWSAGAMGYFPTYSLGAMYACQIFQTAKLDLPTLDEDIAQGKFYGLKAWLIEKIHKSGSFHINGDALMVAVTGKPLDPKIYINYLRDKYTDLYKL